MDEEIEVEEVRKNFNQLWYKLKSFRRYCRYLDVIGNIAFVVALIMQKWFVAFLLFIMFFPDEVEIVRFFKRVHFTFKRQNGNRS